MVSSIIELDRAANHAWGCFEVCCTLLSHETPYTPPSRFVDLHVGFAMGLGRAQDVTTSVDCDLMGLVCNVARSQA